MNKEAMRGVPDAIHHTDLEESLEYIQGWNDCRQAMLEQPAQQEPAGWRPATFHRDNLTFNPGLPDEQTVKFWKLQGVEIEYCYTSPPAQCKPLTDDELADLWYKQSLDYTEFARAVEAAHNIKENT